ncbi:DUF192 domain-containing protein [Candidatus Uhrbacteria bacterium]|nr:DUF192 domain-containing protein [Candidatus Uhrbacteria bacterium]
MMKGILFIVVMAAVFVGAGFIASPYIGREPESASPAQSVVRISGTTIPVEVRSDDRGRAQGLSGRPSLPEGSGMLFLFPRKERYSFWMKEMRFAIDILWIVDGHIADVTPNIPPPHGEPLALYQPRVPVDTVFEVNAGFAAAHGIRVGDPVDIQVDKNLRIE